MAIEEISQEEFEAVHGRSQQSPVSISVKALPPHTGFRTPCTWNHPAWNCSGKTLAHNAARAAGFKVATRCKDKALYVFRYE